MKFVFKAPFNSLSFGQVSLNFTREFYKKGHEVSIHPIGDNVDLTAFDKLDKDFLKWMELSIKNRYKSINIDTPTLQLWHLRGSDNRPTNKSFLYTFHEIEGCTEMEKTLCGLQKTVIFSSSFSKNLFNSHGVKNVDSVGIGFDEDIKKIDKKYLGNDIVHFGLIGKWERRKNTEKIIKNWVELYGNKKEYRLTCLVENPFFEKGAMQQIIRNALGNKIIFNLTFLSRLKTNSEVNDFYNSIDIDLSGLSSAEGWNLPAFNATCLGKWSIVCNNTSHMDWATKDNSILIEPDGKYHPYDGAFFKDGDEFNQGLVSYLGDDTIKRSFELGLNKAKCSNLEGEKLGKDFTYSKTVDKLVEIMEK